jgi:hypothetical protein
MEARGVVKFLGEGAGKCKHTEGRNAAKKSNGGGLLAYAK